jgi:hypothetical protein
VSPVALNRLKGYLDRLLLNLDQLRYCWSTVTDIDQWLNSDQFVPFWTTVTDYDCHLVTELWSSRDLLKT